MLRKWGFAMLSWENSQVVTVWVWVNVWCLNCLKFALSWILVSAKFVKNRHKSSFMDDTFWLSCFIYFSCFLQVWWVKYFDKCRVKTFWFVETTRQRPRIIIFPLVLWRLRPESGAAIRAGAGWPCDQVINSWLGRGREGIWHWTQIGRSASQHAA